MAQLTYLEQLKSHLVHWDPVEDENIGIGWASIKSFHYCQVIRRVIFIVKYNNEHTYKTHKNKRKHRDMYMGKHILNMKLAVWLYTY